jgi:outer membrane protein assembly factor BamA
VDINDLNKDLESGNKLPSTDSIPGIYETYVQSGIIPQKDKSGGDIVLIRSGAITDTRDNESFPTKGYWGEAFVQVSPGLFGNNNYGQFITTFRQYFSLSGDGNPVFAYRLAYSTKLWGDIPFYMLPFYHNTTETRDGFGSGKTIRGILRDRIAADAVLMGNFELRWKFVKFGLFDSNFYLALGLFFDSGIVTSDYELLSYLPVTENANSNGCFHNSCGAGLHVAMNENFILSFDIGKALNKTDGDFGFYIVMSWLY